MYPVVTEEGFDGSAKSEHGLRGVSHGYGGREGRRLAWGHRGGDRFRRGVDRRMRRKRKRSRLGQHAADRVEIGPENGDLIDRYVAESDHCFMGKAR